MQKVSSQETNGQMRSGSGSAPRSNDPYGMNTYPSQTQQPYYPANTQYPNKIY